MRRTISRILVLTMLLYLCMPLASYVYAKENVRIAVNDVCIENSAYIENVGDRLYVSARSVAEPMGLNLRWNDVKKTLIILHKDTSVTLMVASNIAIVNNTAVDAEQPLRIMADRAIVDLGFLCEVLGAEMTFDDTCNTYNVVVEVPEDFEPDVIKDAPYTGEVSLFENNLPEMTRVTEIAEALALEVLWEDSVKALTFSSVSGDNLTLYVGSSAAWFNGDAVECSAPLIIKNDEAYADYGFVENLFSVQVPADYTPAREIARELGLSVEWDDDSKTVSFVDKNGDVLSMAVGSCFYKFNGKFCSNDAPVILKDGVALTDLATVKTAFLNKDASAEEGIELFASTKDFSGQIILTKALTNYVEIDIRVISVQSIVYDKYLGYVFSDYDTASVAIPANTKTVDFCVTKSNWDYYDSYIIGYNFRYSNSYYYDTGYLSYNGGILTSISRYVSDHTRFSGNDSTSDIVIKPKLYSDVSPDDVIFSGVITTDNGATFGEDSVLDISVRALTYYGESVVAKTTLYPEETTQVKFNVPVPNTTSNRNQDLYLHYYLYNGDESIVTRGYYRSSAKSVDTINKARGWDIRYDNVSNITFTVITKEVNRFSGTISLPEDMIVENNREIAFGIDVFSVRYSAYSDVQYLLFNSHENVAVIKPGKNSVSYRVEEDFVSGNYYIFKYRVYGPQNGIAPYGYADYDICSSSPEDARQYYGTSTISDVDFRLEKSSPQYKYINNMPYSDENGNISSNSYKNDSDEYFSGYCIYLTEGQKVSIKLKSYDFDAFLYLLDSDMNVIQYNDDGLGGTNSLINKPVTKSGYYYIQATSVSGKGFGEFTLSINTDKELSGGAAFTDRYYNDVSYVYATDTIVSNFRIENTSDEKMTVRLVMALYDSCNAMVGIKIKDIDVNKGITPDELAMKITSYSDVAMVKSFVLSESFAPIGNVDCLYR